MNAESLETHQPAIINNSQEYFNIRARSGSEMMPLAGRRTSNRVQVMDQAAPNNMLNSEVVDLEAQIRNTTPASNIPDLPILPQANPPTIQEPQIPPRANSSLGPNPRGFEAANLAPSQVQPLASEAETNPRGVFWSKFQASLDYLFSTNSLYNKPNISALAQMISSASFVVFMFVQLSSHSPNFRYVILIYLLDLLLECILQYLAAKWENGYFTFSKWMLLPTSCKAIVLCSVIVDMTTGGNSSVYTSPLLVVPLVMQAIKKVDYTYLRINPTCLSIFITIAEIMIIYKIFLPAPYSFYSCFILLFYYFVVTMFFYIMSFFTAICQCFQAIFSCCKDARVRMIFIQLFLGCDNIVALVTTLLFANWSSDRENLDRMMNSSINSPQDPNSLYLAQQAEANSKILTVKITGCAMGYIILRHCILYYCTKNVPETAGENPFLFGRNLPRRRNAAGSHGEGSRERAPRVQKPGKGDNFLSLFKINTNYYGAAPSSQVAPAQAGKEQAVGNDSEKNMEAQDDPICSICMSNLSNCIILQCYHGGLCKDCAMSILSKSQLCPFCRKEVLKICVIKKINETKFEVLEEIRK